MRYHLAAVLLVIAVPAGAAEFKVFPPAWDDPGFLALPFAAQRESDPRSAECRISAGYSKNSWLIADPFELALAGHVELRLLATTIATLKSRI